MKLVDRFWPFMKTDCRAAEAYLEAQSRKGLHIHHIDDYGVVATYEKGIPKNIKYCIDYLHLDDKEEAEAYETMLADAGWSYVADMDMYLIFASKDGASPVPINTDWREEYRLMRKGLWRYEIPTGILALILCIALFRISTINIDSPEKLCIGIALLSMCGFGMTGLIHSLLYYWNTYRAFKRNEPMNLRSTKRAKKWGIVHALFGVVLGIAIYSRFMCVAYEHWMAGESTAAYCLITTLVSGLAMLLLKNWLSNQDYLPEIVRKGIIMAFVLCTVGGCIGYFIATQ